MATPPARHHAFGWAARDAVEAARKHVSWLVGGDPRQVVFTSGATESNNLAIKGCVAAAGRPAHIVTVATEHRAVLDSCRRLERDGVDVTHVQPRDDGLVDILEVELALTAETVLLTIMTANNEIGVLQPIANSAPWHVVTGCCFTQTRLKRSERSRSMPLSLMWISYP